MRFAFSLVFAAALAPAVSAAEFVLTFDKTALDQPFTGRVHVLLLRNEPRPVAGGLNWFDPEPAFAKDVKDWKPGDELSLDASTAVSTTPLASVKPGTYFAQAVMDRDLGGRSFTSSPGNVYSKPLKLAFDPKTAGKVALKLDQTATEPKFAETDTVKLVEHESARLTKFHGKPMKMRAGVILPPSFATDAGKKYPVVYDIPGFSGTHFGALGIASRKPWDVAGTEMIWVVLDPSCRLGHHTFADSDNNGPCGTALVEELIPEIERRFRGSGTRFVTGHSSGGWASLWLQVAYPDTFHGCWSTSPDSVDFRDFQRIDVYNVGSNAFADSTGGKRPIARRGGKPVLFWRGFSDMEVVMGRGGQLASFEAVFSRRAADGNPEPLWDRKTGALRSDVAKTWERYDIRLVLERNWPALAPKLKGKLHVYMGDVDTFYLEGATRLLKESLSALGSDAVVEMFPGKDHGLIDRALRERMNKEMAAAAARREPPKP
jgi:hypothetical protein